MSSSARQRTISPVLRRRVVQALSSCTTEADLVQVLYAELHPVFGYYSINLQVLEREGWLHSHPVDHGVLQDVRRRRHSESAFYSNYLDPRPCVIHPPGEFGFHTGRGPGVGRRGQTAIWMPIMHGEEPIGAVIYHLHERRRVPPEELSLLEYIHSHLGVLVRNAYLNELTRNQALSLSALNSIAQVLSATHDEAGVVEALAGTLRSLLPVCVVELVVVETEESGGGLRLLRMAQGASGATCTPVSRRSRRLGPLRRVLASGEPRLETDFGPSVEYRSLVCVPLKESGAVRALLSTRCRQPNAYELSTVDFMKQVADQVALALRNAWSYSELEAQRRRLEVVNAVGRRLASSLDRWSIMRTLRDELARFLDFDVFTLATVRETPDGPVAEGYTYDSGEEQPLAPVRLAAAGPSREAYVTGEPILIRRAPWASSLETGHPTEGERVVGKGVVVDVTRPGHHRRIVARSIVWVPVGDGEQVTALMSLQSYRADVFDEWHVRLLQDIATHVSLALANAEHFHAAQTERRRLEALHLLEMGVAGAGDESQVAAATASALRSFLAAPIMMLMYLDPQGHVTGYSSEGGESVRPLAPVPIGRTLYMRRLLVEGVTIAEAVPPEDRSARPHEGWPTWGPHIPAQVLIVPVFNENRVVGALSAQRIEDVPFTAEEVQLVESAAPVVGIALRSVRLHRANELALAHSARLQEVAGLAGHELNSVVDNVALQIMTMLEATGAACWAFDDEGRVTARAVAGDGGATRVLRWSGRTAGRGWRVAPRSPVTGSRSSTAWTLVPLWYGDRLVGALGSIHPVETVGEPLSAVGDFARHAAVAIENARLAAETRGRIHTLEAVAGFANLDITRPESARDEMYRLVERALAGSGGTIWLLEGPAMMESAGDRGGPPAAAGQPGWWAPALQMRGTGRMSRRLQALLRSEPAGSAAPAAWSGELPADRGVFAHPIVVDGQVLGMLTADAKGSSPAEKRRLMAVLAGQVALVLNRLRLLSELNRQTEMLTTVLRHSPVGVLLEDSAGRVAYANPEVERIYGTSADALIGTPAQSLLRRADAMVVSDPEGEPDAPLEVCLQDSGTVVQVQRVAIPGSGDQPARVLTLHQDVTRERAVLEAKDLMLRAIGHEVRSPAAAMRSTIAGVLQWGPVMDEEQRHALIQEAYEQSDRLLSLVENQLLIAKLETRRFEPNRMPIELGPAVEHVLGVLRNRYGSRVDVVDVRMEADLPDASCEATHLEQVMANLIGNALEYTSARCVRVSAEARGGWMEVTVADDGAGVPADRIPTLFAKTGPAGQNRSRGGLGLGLYLSRLVVERSFGGRIWLERTGADGTIFKFTVPAQPARSRRVAHVAP